MRSLALLLALLVAACSSTPAGPGGGGAEGGSGGAGGSGDAGTGGVGGTGGLGAGGLGGTGGDSGPCPALPRPPGTPIAARPGDDLASIVADAPSGSTIELSDGTYHVPATVVFRHPGVTLRSASDQAAAVVLDGDYAVGEILAVLADDVTIAHLTLTHAQNHLVHVQPGGTGQNTLRAHLYALRLLDAGEQFVKINADAGRDAYDDDGTVECSFFRMTDEGRPHVQRDPGGCYTGGVDGHEARGWVIRQNRFEDIYCAGQGLAEHAVHFWTGSRDTLVEQNVISGCARGVGFGLTESGEARTYPDRPVSGFVGHYDGIIRNNFIWADHPYFDTGIELDQADGARVLHNTVVHGPGATGFFSSIDYRFADTSVTLANNLVSRITVRDGAAAEQSGNVEDATLALFVDPASADLHLGADAAVAVDQGVPLPDAGLDIDGQPHSNGSPDVGADERSGP